MRSNFVTGSGFVMLVVVIACGSKGQGFDNKDSGTPFGNDAASDTGFQPGKDSGPIETDTPTAIIRDFKLYDSSDSTTNPDFENPPQQNTNLDDHGLVQMMLGSDGVPAYAPSGATLTVHGPATFQQWYHDTPGINIRVLYPLKLSMNTDGSFGYDSEVSGVPTDPPNDNTNGFFPIDDGTPYATAFGDQGLKHNYSFTMELHTTFTYNGGEYFNFRGDDDVFVFINKEQVIDLGGIHSPETASVSVDTLGLTVGQDYPLDFFSAERHKTGSNILFTTTLNLKPVPVN